MDHCHRPTGVGVGLRIPHYETILTHKPKINWFEAISENYFGRRSLPLQKLCQIREHYPIILHGVSLSIGSTDPLNQHYLTELKYLVDLIKPAWVSDHLSWSSFKGRYCPDLYPLPFTEQALKHVVARIQTVQEQINVSLAFENISRYVDYQHSQMSEVEFHVRVAKQAGCFLLLDINNIYVNAMHHGFEPREYIDHIPSKYVLQYHLGGYTIENGIMLDTHGDKVSDPVWELFVYALKKIGPKPTLIEWDNHIPSLDVLVEQASMAQTLIKTTDGS